MGAGERLITKHHRGREGARRARSKAELRTGLRSHGHNYGHGNFVRGHPSGCGRGHALSHDELSVSFAARKALTLLGLSRSPEPRPVVAPWHAKGPSRTMKARRQHESKGTRGANRHCDCGQCFPTALNQQNERVDEDCENQLAKTTERRITDDEIRAVARRPSWHHA